MYVPMAYALALFCSASVAIAVAALAWKRRGTPGAIGLFAAMLSLTVWAGTYGIRWLMSDESAAIFWLDATYLGVVSAPTAMVCLAYQFANGTKAFSLKKIFVLMIMPLITIILIWTDKYHGFFYGGARTTTAILTGGPWFFVNAVYLYLVNLTALYLLVKAALKAKGIYARQCMMLIFALVLPWIGNIFSLIGLSPLPGLDITPFLFTMSGLILSYGLFKYKLMDMIPIARDFLVEHMSEGIVVIDERNRLVDLNSSARSILGIERGNIGMTFPNSIVQGRELAALFVDDGMMDFTLGLGDRWYDVQVSKFNEEKRGLRGRIFMFRDVTQQKRINEELQYRSTHDILTGLFNRQRYEMEFAKLEMSLSAISLIMVDLDGLKKLNDSLGHGEGDQMLRDAAALLTRSVGEEGLVARAGGDEFLVILEESGGDKAGIAVERIRNNVIDFNLKNKSHAASAGNCPLSFSIGMATRLPGEALEVTLKRADGAMYREKNSKRSL